MVVTDSVANCHIIQQYRLTQNSYFLTNKTLNCQHIIPKQKLHFYAKNKNQCQVSLTITWTKINWNICWTLSVIISFVLKGTVLQKMALLSIAGPTRMRWYLSQDSGPSSALRKADFLLLPDESQAIFRTCFFNKMSWWKVSNTCVSLVTYLHYEC